MADDDKNKDDDKSKGKSGSGSTKVWLSGGKRESRLSFRRGKESIQVPHGKDNAISVSSGELERLKAADSAGKLQSE